MNPSHPSGSLRPLMRPRSIAVLGASARAGSIGATVLQSVRRMGFDGHVWPVNPKYAELEGYSCLGSLADLPAAPDVTAICTKGTDAVEHLRMLESVGGKAAVIYDGGFAEAGEQGASLQVEVAEICARAGMVLCGPNCMGTISFHDRATTYKLPILDAARLKGDVGLVSQSGSVTIGLLGDVRRFGFSHVVSVGNEAVTTLADYIDFLVEDEDTRAIALFVEGVKSPRPFREALARAAEAGKPVVVLKAGRSARAMEAVTSHTGGLAGESRVFSEMLKRAGAIEVMALDEMTEVLAALQVPRLPKGRRIAVITGSGGHTELVLDAASDLRLDLPPLSPKAFHDATANLGHFSGDGNPLDAWGGGDVRKNLGFALSHFDALPDYDAIVLCNENITDAPIGRSEMACAVFCEAAAKSEKPHYLLNTRPGLMHDENLAMLGKAGAGMLSGLRQGLASIDAIANWQTGRMSAARPAAAGRRPSPLHGETRVSINEYDAKRILRGFGVPVVPEQIAASIDEAVAFAGKIGWPVVLKVVSDTILHKTEYGLVALNIADADGLQQAWNVLSDRATRSGSRDHRMLVQKMVVGGVEVFAGIKRDRQWGHVLAFGAGGTLIEVINEMALRLLPVTGADVEAMLSETRASILLAGVRGAPRADVAALELCLLRLAEFALASGDDLSELDLNPIKVLPEGQGCFVVDALITRNV